MTASMLADSHRGSIVILVFSNLRLSKMAVRRLYSVAAILVVFSSCAQVSAQQQALSGASCIADQSGTPGTCYDIATIAVSCPSSFQVAQGNCVAGTRCCYVASLLGPLFTFPPDNSFFTTPNPFFNQFPTTQNPFFNQFPTTAPWWQTTQSFFWPQTTPSPFWGGVTPQPQPGGGRCGRLRSAAEIPRVSLPEGFDPSVQERSDSDGNATKTATNQRVKRIVGGEPVADGDLCYQVTILSGNLVIATGALLSQDYVITSYSSISRTDATGTSLRVLLGGYSNINTITGAVPGYRVIRAIQAPGYQVNFGPGFPVNDVALLQIDRAGGAIDWTRNCVLCLRQPNVRLGCQRRFASGYGATSEGSTTSDGVLRRVDLALIPIAVCENAYRNVFSRQFRFDGNSICAGGEGGRDTCNRDGGAPLVCETFGYGERYLEGVSSWGYGCGRPGFPGVYTNVTSMASWIQQFVPLG